MSWLYKSSWVLILIINLISILHAEEKTDEQSKVNCQSNIEKQLPLEKSKIKLIKEIHDEIIYPKSNRSISSGSSRVIKSTEIKQTTSLSTNTSNRQRVSIKEPKEELESNEESTSFLSRIKKKLLSLSNYSKRRCAEGVRNILNTLFKKNVDSGPPAKKYNENFLSQWNTSNSCYKESRDDGNEFKNFDIRVLQPKDKREAGHIEIFLDGKWYSDFKQQISLWNGGFSKYSSKKLYRYASCSNTSFIQFLKHILDVDIIDSALATIKEIIDDKTPFEKIEEVLAESKTFQIKQVFQDQGTDYLLIKKTNRSETFVDKDSNSIYLLLNRIKDKKLQNELAKNILETWIKKDGRPIVQKYILEFDQLTEIQKRSYLEAGLQLPNHYEIYPK